MITVGCDYHPGFQQIAFVYADTGRTAKAAAAAPRGNRGSTAISRHKG